MSSEQFLLFAGELSHFSVTLSRCCRKLGLFRFSDGARLVRVTAPSAGLVVQGSKHHFIAISDVRASSGATLAGVLVLSVVGFAMSERGSSSEGGTATGQPKTCGIIKNPV